MYFCYVAKKKAHVVLADTAQRASSSSSSSSESDSGEDDDATEKQKGPEKKPKKEKEKRKQDTWGMKSRAVDSKADTTTALTDNSENKTRERSGTKSKYLPPHEDYTVGLVLLLAQCAAEKNYYTEKSCHKLLSFDKVSRLIEALFVVFICCRSF